MSSQKNRETLMEELLQVYPERCRPCGGPESRVGLLASQVGIGVITMDQALEKATTHASDVERHCVLGPTAVQGCMGSPTRCTYGERI